MRDDQTLQLDVLTKTDDVLPLGYISFIPLQQRVGSQRVRRGNQSLCRHAPNRGRV
jgi:hypothetical protein